MARLEAPFQVSTTIHGRLMRSTFLKAAIAVDISAIVNPLDMIRDAEERL